MISSLLSLLSALLLYRILLRLGCQGAGAWLGALAFFYSPMVILFSVNGLETAAVVAAVCLLYATYLSGCAERPAGAAALGAAGALAVLGRTDMVFFAAPLLGVVFCQMLWTRRYRQASAIVVAGALLMLPWLLWNKTHFGGLLQVSGKALSLYEHRNFAVDHPGVGLMDKPFLDEVSRHVHSGLVKWGFNSGISPIRWEQWNGAFSIAWALAGALGLLWLVSLFRRDRAQFARLSRLWPFMVFVPLYFVAHEAVRWASREWYAAVPGLLFFLSLAVLADLGARLLAQRIRAAALGAAALGLVLVYLFQFAAMYRQGLYPGQASLIEGVRLLRRDHPAHTRIGSSDAGYMGYACPEYQIINLDGLVNNHAFEAARDHRLAAYIAENTIEVSYIRPYLAREHFLGEGWQKLLLEGAGRYTLRKEKPFGESPLVFVSPSSPGAQKTFASGWSAMPRPDEELWNNGTSATLRLEIPPTSSPLALALFACPFFFDPAKEQTLCIRVNGHAPSAPVPVRNYWSVTAIPLPLQQLVAGKNEIELSFGYAKKPCEINPACSDDRLLALDVRAIGLMPVNELQAAF